MFRMRRGHVLVLLGLASGMLSVLLAVAVNVATGGVLPGALAPLSRLAWPAVGVLSAVTVGLSLWQQTLHARVESPIPTLPDPDLPRTIPAELPAAAAGFAGRSSELSVLRARVDAGVRVLCLSGPPGVGKSALAVRLAHELADRYPDGQLAAALGGGQGAPAPAETILARFLYALDAPIVSGHPDVDWLAARFRTTVADRRLLIFLDDARDAEQVRPLLPAAPGCLTLVTSRWPLAALTEGESHTVTTLADAEALTLLTSLVGEPRVAADPAAAGAVVAACGGLPLALRIAGARLRARPQWSIDELARRLSDERIRLDELRVGDLAVRSCFASASNDLSELDRRVFRRLAAYPGRRLSPASAAAVAGVDEPTGACAMEVLADAQLVESVGAGVYRIHDLLRLFATEQLTTEEPPAEPIAALERLLGWYGAAIVNADGDWVRNEREDLTTAVHAAVEQGLFEPALGLAEIADAALRRMPDRAYLRVLCQDGVSAARELGEPERLAQALMRAGWAENADGYAGRAVQHLSEAVAAWHDLGDATQEADAHRFLGDALRNAGRHADAAAELERALAMYRAQGRRRSEGDALAHLGVLYLTRDDPAAIEVLEQAVAIGDETPGQRTDSAFRLVLLGAAYTVAGRLTEGRPMLEDGLAIYRQAGDRRGEGFALRELGRHADKQARFDEGANLHQASIAIHEDINDLGGLGLSVEAAGDNQMAQHEPVRAADSFTRAAGIWHSLGDPVREGISLLKVAEALAVSGHLIEAAARQAAAEELLGDIDVPDADILRAALNAKQSPQ